MSPHHPNQMAQMSQGLLLKGIHHIYPFLYANAFWGLWKLYAKKVRKFATKSASRQNSVKYDCWMAFLVLCLAYSFNWDGVLGVLVGVLDVLAEVFLIGMAHLLFWLAYLVFWLAYLVFCLVYLVFWLTYFLLGWRTWCLWYLGWCICYMRWSIWYLGWIIL